MADDESARARFDRREPRRPPLSYAHDLWLMVGGQYLVFGLIWLLAARNRHAPNLRLGGIGWFNVLLGLGFALGALSAHLPPSSARTGANLLQVLAFVVAWITATDALAIAPRRGEVIAVAVGSSALIVWLGNSGPSGDARVAVCLATLTYLLLRMAAIGWRPIRQRHGARVAVAAVSIAVVVALALLAQVVVAAWTGRPIEIAPDSERSLLLAYAALFGMALVNALLGYGVLRSILGQLERLTLHDALTGLANRRCLLRRLDEQWHRWRRSGATFAVLCLDIDHFKSVNDVYGHPAGDRVLVMVGSAVGQQLRPNDLVARNGGEEFVVVLEDVPDLGSGAQVGERLRASVEALPAGDGALPRPVTVSVGVALVDPGDGALDRVLARADAALYDAKRAGRNRVEIAASLPVVSRARRSRSAADFPRHADCAAAFDDAAGSGHVPMANLAAKCDDPQG